MSTPQRSIGHLSTIFDDKIAIIRQKRIEGQVVIRSKGGLWLIGKSCVEAELFGKTTLILNSHGKTAATV